MDYEICLDYSFLLYREKFSTMRLVCYMLMCKAIGWCFKRFRYVSGIMIAGIKIEAIMDKIRGNK